MRNFNLCQALTKKLAQGGNSSDDINPPEAAVLDEYNVLHPEVVFSNVNNIYAYAAIVSEEHNMYPTNEHIMYGGFVSLKGPKNVSSRGRSFR
jgi:hypothetical protein